MGPVSQKGLSEQGELITDLDEIQRMCAHCTLACGHCLWTLPVNTKQCREAGPSALMVTVSDALGAGGCWRVSYGSSLEGRPGPRCPVFREERHCFWSRKACLSLGCCSTLSRTAAGHR